MKLAAVLMTFACAACGGSHSAAESNGTPSPLGSCETRIIELDGAQAVVTSNIDGTLANVDIVKAPDPAARTKAVDDAIHYFGPVRRDTRTIERQGKWGLATLTDPCGRPVAAPGARPATKAP